MEYIRKSIYSLPEIRHTLLPLWSGWALTAVGAVCGVLYIKASDVSAGVTSALIGGALIGACSLLLTLCFYLFGDSRRPYSRELHAVLEPTYNYYSQAAQQALVDALQARDEQALGAIKSQAIPELALVRYSDKEERVFYSQLTRVEGHNYIPLTEIITNKNK